MIEIIKERTLSVKEMKDKFKSGSMIEMLKVPKFTCSVYPFFSVFDKYII